MKQLKRWRYVLAFFYAALCSTTQASDDSFPAKLSRQERLQLEQTVCGAQYGLAVAEIDARSMEANGRANFADVKCRPHAQLAGQPTYYVAVCGRDGNQWSCGEAELETIVPLAQRKLLVRPGTVDPLRGVTTLKKISSYGYFQGLSIDKALQSTCNMGMGNRPDLIEISCQRWSITVSFWCPQTKQDPTCPRVIYMAEH
ncbi:hypothetical protein H8K32_10440 [Undibacterium jejuense]|uniref:Uncharacterized protein n=1 Tax=Undibacterium jejuense TaxID=1344949 RepID=A0A923HHH4_9BURK|nr:hypothetical protein [Undibacterium jejuense]MBC3862518.1 hypothetical protein [Undibacterium jejuense]